MLSVQIVIGSAEVDRMNGSTHSRYHGYTTGAHNSDAAIGQAKASGDDSADLALIQIAVRKLRERNSGFASSAALLTDSYPVMK